MIQYEIRVNKAGENEAKNLNLDLKNLGETILVSPLTRTIQTCLLVTNEEKKNSVEWVREYPAGVYTPNNRKSISYLQEKYKTMIFLKLKMMMI